MEGTRAGPLLDSQSTAQRPFLSATVGLRLTLGDISHEADLGEERRDFCSA
jgi:hypothetical protein